MIRTSWWPHAGTNTSVHPILEGEAMTAFKAASGERPGMENTVDSGMVEPHKEEFS